MNFEQAYENYISGKASDEEKAFVEGEIAKAKKLTEIIDTIDHRKDIFAPGEMEDVKRAQKKHFIKNIIRTTIIVVTCLLITTGVICGAIFGTAISSANTNTKYDIEQAKAVAIEFVNANYTTTSGAVLVTEFDKELKIGSKLKYSSYVYYIDVQNGSNMKIELSVNAQTGLVTLIEID